MSSQNLQFEQTMSLDDWLEKLADLQFPVFPETARVLHALNDEDLSRSVDRLCSNVLFDPGGVIALLRKANSSRQSGMGTRVVSVENAAMMIGMNAMRTLVDTMPQIQPPGSTAAEQGYMKIVARAYHVGYQAYDWAIQRGDMTPKEIFVAAFLHDLGAMVLWLYASDKMQAVHELKWEQEVSDDEAQYVILGFSQEKLGQKLSELWRLPEMVTECLQAEDAHNPRPLTVRLASKLVHLSETGWYTEEMVECLESVARLLDKDFDEVVKMVHKNALEVARETAHYGISCSASLLPMTSADWPTVHGEKRDENAARHFCLVPQGLIYEQTLEVLSQVSKNSLNQAEILELAVAGLHDGLGLNRVVFAYLRKDRIKLEGHYIQGADSDPNFSQFSIDVELSNKDLFTQLLQKPRSVWVNKENHERLGELLPEEFKTLIQTDEFYAMSIFYHGKPLGIFYADRHLRDSHLDDKSYAGFKKLCLQVSKALEQKDQQ